MCVHIKFICVMLQTPPPPKPKVKASEQKALYSRFVKATNPSDDLGTVTKHSSHDCHMTSH